MKTEQPSISKTAFNCPFCGAFAHQRWMRLLATPVELRLELESLQTHILPGEITVLQHLEILRHRKGECGSPETLNYGILGNKTENIPNATFVDNISLSVCEHCKKPSIWIGDKIVSPVKKYGPAPNQDLPDDIKRDYEEAREIANASPRGAAALLRLAVQKLCRELGEKGRDLNSDIASLVKKGLSPTVQKSLDAVRVIGNESVHPGEMDMRDDRITVERLFELVNLIADQMITHPKNVGEVYSKLPEDKRKKIDERDS